MWSPWAVADAVRAAEYFTGTEYFTGCPLAAMGGNLTMEDAYQKRMEIEEEHPSLLQMTARQSRKFQLVWNHLRRGEWTKAADVFFEILSNKETNQVLTRCFGPKLWLTYTAQAEIGAGLGTKGGIIAGVGISLKPVSRDELRAQFRNFASTSGPVGSGFFGAAGFFSVALVGGEELDVKCGLGLARSKPSTDLCLNVSLQAGVGAGIGVSACWELIPEPEFWGIYLAMTAGEELSVDAALEVRFSLMAEDVSGDLRKLGYALCGMSPDLSMAAKLATMLRDQDEKPMPGLND
jgi:hypothetical protein